MKTLIGLCGKARSGKDTVANHLCDYAGFTKTAFAGPLKKLVADLFDMNHKQMYGELKETIDKRYGKSPRWLLQYIGTDIFRNLYPNIWVDYAMRRFKNQDNNVVVCDVRFPNEMQSIKDNGGYVWKIVREDHCGATNGIEGHASEVEMDTIKDEEFDCVITAKSGDLFSLKKQATDKYWQLTGK